MKNQYFGDFNDYLKYSLIRRLTGNGDLKTAVCWLLTPNEERTDGNKVKYLEQPHLWRRFDPFVFDFLTETVKNGMLRDTQLVEGSSLLPNTVFFNDLIGDELEMRTAFFRRFSQISGESDLIFFDPDNGLETKSVRKGKRKSSKYIFWDEVNSFYKKGHSIMIYQHFPRQERRRFVENTTKKADEIISPCDIFTYSTSYVLFLLLVQHKHDKILRANTESVFTLYRKIMRIDANYNEVSLSHQ